MPKKSDQSIEQQIDDADRAGSAVAVAILVLAREVRTAREMVAEFTGHNGDGHLDVYARLRDETLSEVGSSIAGALDGIAEKIGASTTAKKRA